MISMLKRLDPRDIRLLLAAVLCVVAFVASSDDSISSCNNLADNLGVLKVPGLGGFSESIYLVNYSGPEKGTISNFSAMLEVTRTLKAGHYAYTSTYQKMDATGKFGPNVVGRSGSFDINAGETTSLSLK